MYAAHSLVLVYSAMRKLAKTNKYQTLYNQYKETGVRIFQNECNLTDYQIAFIQYLAFYNNLHTDIYMNEVSDIVLEDELYEDAYMYYKQKSRKKEKQDKMPNRSQSIRPQSATTSNTHIVFSRHKSKARSK